MTNITPSIRSLIAQGALFVINHSAGKDSQYMTARLIKIVPKEQLVIVHANLGKYEWHGVIEHIHDNNVLDLPVYVCRNENKTFMEMVLKRGMFPDKSRRQCTSDLKRDPIEKQIRQILKSWKGPQIIVNCVGIRAEESTSRAKLEPFKLNNRMTTRSRTVYEWLPIHSKKIEQVKAGVAAAGQKLHWAYSQGMTRLSCCFCIMANKGDLQIAARLRPELYKEYVETERAIGHTLQMSGKSLEEITGIKI